MSKDEERRKAREAMTIAEKMDPGPDRDAKIAEAEALTRAPRKDEPPPD